VATGKSNAAGNTAGTAGVLYVVATPIGNLEDLSGRAVRVLSSVDLILAEDTRHSARMLAHYGIDRPKRSLHEHNEARLCEQIVRRIAAGERIALISDAGTPLISDPGYRLVARLREHGHRVVPIPGACAAISALSVAGLPTDRFCFEGFLPARSGPRRRRLEQLAGESRTLVFYEAPHRVLATVACLAEVFGAERAAVIARELTKVHETVRKGSLRELHQWLEAEPVQRKGEFVIIVAADSHGGESPEVEHEVLLRVLLEELPLKQAVAVAVRLTGAPRNALYRRAVALTGSAGEQGEP
jgi:16S rRNA (cytidine1402-2'-O)-methyltransferase